MMSVSLSVRLSDKRSSYKGTDTYMHKYLLESYLGFKLFSRTANKLTDCVKSHGIVRF